MATTAHYIQECIQETLESRERSFKEAIREQLKHIANIHSQMAELSKKLKAAKEALHAMKLEEFDVNQFN